jgi:hypothetical protein
LSNETAWKARFARLWNASAKADVTHRTLAQQRALVALEAYRQVAMPGLPGPTALSRVAGVSADFASRVLAALRVAR